MTNELALRQTLTPDVWRMIMEIAPVMAQSRLFGVASPEQSASIMLKGFELGLSLTASFEFIHLIDGKPSLSPRGALALIQTSPNFGGLEVQDISDANGKPERCRVTMTRKNGYSYKVEFTMEDAARADLIKSKGGWDKYPANMLRWRAIGYCADVVFPDVLGGMKRVDELGGDISKEGEFIIEMPQTPPVPVQQGSEPSIPSYGIDTARLIELASTEEIMAANGGQFPLTPDDVNRTVHALVTSGKITLEVQNDTSIVDA